MNPHRHKYSIADTDAVAEYTRKLSAWDSHQHRREKLLKALAEAAQQSDQASDEKRKAFFHGLLTGYAVALKLW
ncbi:MAG: hypothetical protein ACRD1I_07100 [Terriglobia bacterium]